MQGPSPYVKGQRFFTVAGACHRDVERIMKHPQLTLNLTPTITKWDIFHYIYAVLHHPDYRETERLNFSPL